MGYGYGNQPPQQMYPQQYQYQQPYPLQPFPQYQQFQQQQPMPYPSQNPPMLTQLQQLQLPTNQKPPRPTQLPAQLVANSRNKVDRPTYHVEEATYYPTYSILPVQDLHLRSGKVLQKNSPPIIEEQIEQGEQSEQSQPEKQI